MALWIHGGQVETVESGGVTLMVRVMSARDMIDYLKRASMDPTKNGGLEAYQQLVLDGIQGWAGADAPEFGQKAVDDLSFGALQKIVKTVIEVNSMMPDERGNSHAS